MLESNNKLILRKYYFVRRRNSIGVYGFGTLGMALYVYLKANYFIGWKNSLSTQQMKLRKVKIYFNKKDYSYLSGKMSNGLKNAWEHNNELPELILLATRIEGVYEFIKELVTLLYKAQKIGIKKFNLPICVICTNGIEIVDFYNRMLRIIEASGLQGKDNFYELLKSVFIFGATYQTSFQDHVEPFVYNIQSIKKGMIILGGTDKESVRIARKIFSSRNYHIKVNKDLKFYVKKNLTALLHGILPIIYLSEMSSPILDDIMLKDVINPLKNSIDKFINVNIVANCLEKDKAELTAAYCNVMNKIGFDICKYSPKNLYKSIDSKAEKLRLENHIPSHVRYFRFAVQNRYPMVDEISILNRLSAIASQNELDNDNLNKN